MARISVNVDGHVTALKVKADGDCLWMDYESRCGDGDAWPYQKGSLILHGSIADFRAFAGKILAALPAQQAVELIQAEPEPIESAIAEVLS